MNPARASRQDSLAAFKMDCDSFIKVFFETGIDPSDLIKFLKEHENDSNLFDYLIVRIIRKAFDSNELRVIESIAGLFVVAVSAGLVTQKVIARAFEKLFHIIDDLAIDVPGIYDTVVELISTGIDDQILPDGYLFRTPINVLKSVQQAQRRASVTPTVEVMEAFRQDVKHFLSGPNCEFWNLGAEDALVEIEIFLKAQPYATDLRHELVRPLITKAMTMANHHREIVSQVLASGTGDHGSLFSPEDVTLGFARIFLFLADTKLDIPNVQNLLAKFFARAIVDEVVPPSFLQFVQRLSIGGSEGLQVSALVEDWVDPEYRKNLAVKYENIWKGSDPTSEIALECRRNTRAAINALYDQDDTAIVQTVYDIQSTCLTPDLATVCVRVIIETVLERDLEERIVVIAMALLRKLKAVHELDGSNIRDAIAYLNTHDRLNELKIDIGPTAIEKLNKVSQLVSEEGLCRD